MDKIECLEKYFALKILLIKGCKGNPDYFAKELQVSKRTIFRFINYLKNKDNLNVKYNKQSGTYYLD